MIGQTSGSKYLFYWHKLTFKWAFRFKFTEGQSHTVRHWDFLSATNFMLTRLISLTETQL